MQDISFSPDMENVEVQISPNKSVFVTPAGHVVMAQIWGQKIFFTVPNPRDSIQKKHFRGSFYELEELEIIRTYLPPDAVYMDIGANVGNHSLFALKFLRAKQSILFEPNPDVVPILLSNMMLNDLIDKCDTSFLGMGLSDKAADGLEMFIGKPTNLGGGRMVTPAEGGTLKVIRGDDALAGRKVDFIKMDVEGMEMQVLEGLSETIAQYRPTMFIEVDRVNAQAFTDWTERFGYRAKASYKRYRSNENFLIVPKRVRAAAGDPTE
jgi:FkbM family methyltransferase